MAIGSSVAGLTNYKNLRNDAPESSFTKCESDLKHCTRHFYHCDCQLVETGSVRASRSPCDYA